MKNIRSDGTNEGRRERKIKEGEREGGKEQERSEVEREEEREKQKRSERGGKNSICTELTGYFCHHCRLTN